MVAIEEILWNIFTFYGLSVNPKDPCRLHSTVLLKLCKDVMLMDNTSMTEHALTKAELFLIYTSVLNHPNKVMNINFRQMSYNMHDVCSFVSNKIRRKQIK